MLRRLLILLGLLLWPALGQAQHIRPELVAEGPAVPGGEVELAIVMHTSPGWHGYWLNPGDAGLPPSFEWRLPPGFSIGPLRYPVPVRLSAAGLMNYVYEQDYALLARLKVPNGASGTVPIRASGRWLACTDKICVPEQGSVALDLAVGSGSPERARFDRWRSALPQPLGAPVAYAFEGGRLRLAIPLPGAIRVREPYVFPATQGVADYQAVQSFGRLGDWLIAELPATAAPSGRFEGVLALEGGRGLSFSARPGAVPNAGETPSGQADGARREALLLAILGALAGGILLNLMPCVFPILALKALHLARAGGEAGEARSDALGYTLGAVVGTGALGALLLAIRAAGAEAGWAFQLQDPRSILLLLLLAVAITANLLGLFELPALGGGARPAGSVGTGALAAFVATPCAGPFLGAALGTALLLPPLASVLVFASLGLGLALPFLLIAFVPPLRRLLPRQGPWMKRLQRFLAIPMAASAAAALWLSYRLGGERGLVAAIGWALMLALVLAWFGAAQRRGTGRGAIAIALALGITGAAVATAPAASRKMVDREEQWSEARVAKELAAGHKVLVYFTADWCLTCKVNEAAAIDRREVRRAFEKAGVTVLEGDWTDGDPEITRFLESRGRAGVPLTLWYEPGDETPEELPQLLTPAMLIERAEGKKRR